GSASYSARTGPGKHRARSGCTAFPFELAIPRPSGVRSHANSIRRRGIRFDCSTFGNRGDPPNMARIATVTRATRTFRLSHDARNNRAPEATRRFVAKELDSKKLQTRFQIAERSVGQNIVSCYRRVPSIDW